SSRHRRHSSAPHRPVFRWPQGVVAAAPRILGSRMRHQRARPTLGGRAPRALARKRARQTDQHRARLLEELPVNGSVRGWRRDAEAGPMALRITEKDLKAVAIKAD